MRWSERAGAWDLASAVVVAALVAYVAQRTTSLSITIDEALTARWHVPGTWLEIVLMRTPGLEDNNHILYSLLAKVSVATLGLSEFALRLPSLVSYACFLVVIIAILRRMAPGYMQVLGLCLIGLNPYLVDYFTVARGYGLALALATAGLLYLVDALDGAPDTVRPWSARLAILFFTLAATAHLSLLLMLLAAFIVLVVPFAMTGRARALWHALWPDTPAAWAVAIAATTLQAYLLQPLMVLRRQRSFAAGEAHSFWSGTVGSLVDGTLHDIEHATVMRGMLFLWIVASLLLAAWLCVARHDRPQMRPMQVILSMLVLVSVGSVVQHLAFGVALLDGRRALFFLPLLLLVATGLPHAARSPTYARLTAVAAGTVIPAFLIAHALLRVNFTHARDWRFDAEAREAMDAVVAAGKHATEPVRLALYWPMEPSAEFYRAKLDAAVDIVQLKDGYPLPIADFWYVPRRVVPTLVPATAVPLRQYEVAQTVLLAAPAIADVIKSSSPLRSLTPMSKGHGQ